MNLKIFIVSLIAIFSQSVTLKAMEEKRKNEGYSDLWHAIRSKDLDRVKKIVEAGVDVNYVSSEPHFEKEPLLVTAARESNEAIVRYLLSKGASVDVRNEYGITPLISTDDPKIMQTLLEYKADVNGKGSFGSTPLISVAKGKNHVPLARILIAHGAKINEQDNDGKTALMWAANYGRTDMIRYLLSQPSINVELKDKEGKTALDIARTLWLSTRDPKYQEVGRAILEYFKVLSPQGRIAKAGLQQTRLPKDVLEYLRTFMGSEKVAEQK